MNPKILTTSLALLVLAVYLFANRPAVLVGKNAEQSRSIPVATALDIVALESEHIRTLYTKEIVGAGQKVGLGFSEDWRQPGVEAGPLPALFLREMAVHLEKSPVRLGLFLGSDKPITPANRFVGRQAENFAKLRATRSPRHFFVEDTQLFTSMYPDIAVVEPCIRCHNDDKRSPKRDWKLGDVMGATTWTYPHPSVTLPELLLLLHEVRQAAYSTYRRYLEKTQTFASPPVIGGLVLRWSLPSVDEFRTKVEATVSAGTLRQLLEASRGKRQI